MGPEALHRAREPQVERFRDRARDLLRLAKMSSDSRSSFSTKSREPVSVFDELDLVTDPLPVFRTLPSRTAATPSSSPHDRRTVPFAPSIAEGPRASGDPELLEPSE